MPRAEATGLSSKGKGYRAVEFEGFEILVGKADADNDRLTFAVAEPRDFWLHVSGPAGSHVIVRNPLGLDALPRTASGGRPRAATTVSGSTMNVHVP